MPNAPETLRSRRQTLLDATRDDIFTALTNTGARSRKLQLLIYYAGHVYNDRDTDERTGSQ